MEDLPSPRRRTTTSGSLTWADARGASPGYPKTATLAPPSDLESRFNRDPADPAVAASRSLVGPVGARSHRCAFAPMISADKAGRRRRRCRSQTGAGAPRSICPCQRMTAGGRSCRSGSRRRRPAHFGAGRRLSRTGRATHDRHDSWSGCRLSALTPTDASMDERWLRFRARFQIALAEQLEGRPEAFKTLWSHSPDVSIFGALGGLERGWTEVGPRLDWVSGPVRASDLRLENL